MTGGRRRGARRRPANPGPGGRREVCYGTGHELGLMYGGLAGAARAVLAFRQARQRAELDRLALAEAEAMGLGAAPKTGAEG